MRTRVPTVVLPLVLVALAGCGGGDDAEKEPANVAWATVGREITSGIKTAYLAGDIHSDASRGLFDSYPDPDDGGDLFGLDASAVMDVVCGGGETAMAEAEASSRELAEICDAANEVLELSPLEAPMRVGAATEIFENMDRGWVAAGASDQPISTEGRGAVLTVILTELFGPFLDGSARDNDSPSLRGALAYVCPSMLGSGDASISNCRELMDALSYPNPNRDGSLDYAEPSEVAPAMEKILAALAAAEMNEGD